MEEEVVLGQQMMMTSIREVGGGLEERVPTRFVGVRALAEFGQEKNLALTAGCLDIRHCF